MIDDTRIRLACDLNGQFRKSKMVDLFRWKPSMASTQPWSRVAWGSSDTRSARLFFCSMSRRSRVWRREPWWKSSRRLSMRLTCWGAKLTYRFSLLVSWMAASDGYSWTNVIRCLMCIIQVALMSTPTMRSSCKCLGTSSRRADWTKSLFKAFTNAIRLTSWRHSNQLCRHIKISSCRSNRWKCSKTSSESMSVT